MRYSHLTLLGLLLLGLCACDQNGSAADRVALTPAVAKPADGQKLSYNRDIRPILSDKCFACHGPDKNARSADLRLDITADSEQFFGAYSAIEPGDPASSELVNRIYSKKSRFVMPPPQAHVPLTEEEMALLVRWIEEGAEYEPHWAFVPVSDDIEPPVVENEKWVRDEIDRFVLARLEAEGLQPSPQASRERWLRRASYTLTGLPPTAEELDAFVSDPGDDAYEREVDRMLASPHFGERMAVPWLDLARYADTYGFSVDGMRLSWPYRDWVIQAFNQNLPYDQFLTWQLAGDLLPEASGEQVLATAFNRLHRMNAEGGAIREEWRNEAVADRLHTFGTAFTGMTLECARCHDHRYDPISHEEYYELFSFFNSIDESGTTEFNRPDIIPPPSLLLPNQDQADTLAHLRDAMHQAEQAHRQIVADRSAAFNQWIQNLPRHTSAEPAIPGLVGDFAFDQPDANKLVNQAIPDKPGSVGKHQSTTVPQSVEGKQGQALRFDGDNFAQLPGLAHVDRWTPFTVAMWLKVDQIDDGPPRVVAKRTSGTDVGPYGFDLMLDGPRLVARAYRHWPGNAIGVKTADLVKPDQWTHVVWRYDGSSTAEGLSILVNGKRVETEVVRDGPMKKSVGGGQAFGPGGKDLILGQRFRDRGLSGGVIDQVKLIDRAIADIEAADLYDGQSLADAMAARDTERLADYYFSAIDPESRDALAALTAARRAFVEHETKIPEIAVMKEMATPRPAHILERGVYNAERTEENRVVRDVPEAIMPWVEGQPRDRLGLTRWLTHPDHPLTARVGVNRLWQICFGRGIVATSDNFGLQGALPTHPELLDYLAKQYAESGWDSKAMLKRFVLSATFRQDSRTTTDRWRNDPDNVLLSRGPARRLDAEMIRDTALAASGLLVRDLGGKPVYPYQPEGLWKEVSGSTYRVGKGDALYRRSIYTVWKRAVPVPNMMAFDTPTREACAAQRSPTNTPLQALVLLNDEQYVEAARVLAQRVMLEAQDDADRVILGFKLLAGRAPTDHESKRLLDLLDHQRELFAQQPDDAKGLIHTGQSQVDPSLNPVEHAAFTVTMHAILNLDAAIWLR